MGKAVPQLDASEIFGNNILWQVVPSIRCLCLRKSVRFSLLQLRRSFNRKSQYFRCAFPALPVSHSFNPPPLLLALSAKSLFCCELVANHKLPQEEAIWSRHNICMCICICMWVYIYYACVCGIELPLFFLMNANFIAWYIFEILAKCTMFCPHIFCCTSKWGEIYAHTIKNL